MLAILVSQLNLLISHYSSPDQGGVIPQRNITDNIKKTLHIIHHYHQSSSPLLLQAIDIEKAFDRLEHKYIHEHLHHMGFCHQCISIIDTMYVTPMAQVQVNNINSQLFPITRITRGTRTSFSIDFCTCYRTLGMLNPK